MTLDQNELVYYRPTGGRVKISSTALLKINQFRQNTIDATEAGGVLLGRYILGSEDIVVDDVTLPHNQDKRYRYRFIRNQRSHQQEIIKYWKQSNATCNYLGEWHTHPEPVPHPSHDDIYDWKRILRQAQFDSQSLLFIIVGTGQISVWESFKHSQEIKKLDIVTGGKVK